MASPPPPSPPPSPPLSPPLSPPPPPSPSPFRPPPPDLHTMVALAASFQSPNTRLPVNNWRFNQPDKPRPLDAIAALCVDPEHPRPVAVALTIDPKILQVRLLISHDGADRLDARLLNHLRKTWGLLRTLSQKHLNSTRRIGEMTGVEPVFRYMYQVHQLELLRVFREWWPTLDAAHRAVGRHLRHSKPDLLSARFMSVALALRMAFRIMGDDLSLLTQKQWAQLLCFMDQASARVKILFQKWQLCEYWGVDFIDPRRDGSRSPVRCALENLMYLHRYIDILTGFARFARPINFFSHSLHVSFLPLSPHPTRPPIDWKSALLSFSYQTESFIAWCTNNADHLTKTYSTPQRCTPHPECALIMYLQSKRGSPTPALGYIGLSAPTCAACNFWMEAYRTRKIMRFRYRGGSNAWCWPWAFTRGVDEKALIQDVLNCCRHYLDRKGAFNRDSSFSYDSSLGLLTLEELPWVHQREEPPWVYQREELPWVYQREEPCLFGCYVRKGRGCNCVAVLWGEPQKELEDSDDEFY